LSYGANVFNSVGKVPYQNAVYGVPVPLIPLGSGFDTPSAIALDRQGDLFVGNYVEHNSLIKVPLINGAYGSPAQIGANLAYPGGISVDNSGDVFVFEGGSVNFVNHSGTPPAIAELPFTNGSYGPVAPFSLPSVSLPGLFEWNANGDLFVSGSPYDAVTEFPPGNSGYGAPIAGPSFPGSTLGFIGMGPQGLIVSLDNGSVNQIAQLPLTIGSFGQPIVVGTYGFSASGFGSPSSFAADGSGNLYVAGAIGGVIRLPYMNGAYGVPANLLPHAKASAIAVDTTGNVYLALAPGTTATSAVVQKLPYSNGNYGQPLVVTSTASIGINSIAVDGDGNVFLAEGGAVQEVRYSNGTYGSVTTIMGDGFSSISVDGSDNLYLSRYLDTTNADSTQYMIQKVPYSNGSYGTPVTIASLASSANAPVSVPVNASVLSVDSAGNVYYVDGSLMKMSFVNGAYTAPVPVFSGASMVAVDGANHVYALDAQYIWRGNPWST